MASKFKQALRLDIFKEIDTVWTEFTPLARQYNAINLGQGFPDWKLLPFV
jgi:hypothetical protein